MVIGVHHVWRHRRRADADDDEAVRTRTSSTNTSQSCSAESVSPRVHPRTAAGARQPHAPRMFPRAPTSLSPLGNPLFHNRHRRSLLLKRGRCQRAHACAIRRRARCASRARAPYVARLLGRVALSTNDGARGGFCAWRGFEEEA